MVIFWVSVLALSILLYVLLDGFDLGVGVLFGLTRDEHRRRAMMSAVAPVWDGAHLIAASIREFSSWSAALSSWCSSITCRQCRSVIAGFRVIGPP